MNHVDTNYESRYNAIILQPTIMILLSIYWITHIVGAIPNLLTWLSNLANCPYIHTQISCWITTWACWVCDSTWLKSHTIVSCGIKCMAALDVCNELVVSCWSYTETRDGKHVEYVIQNLVCWYSYLPRHRKAAARSNWTHIRAHLMSKNIFQIIKINELK